MFTEATLRKLWPHGDSKVPGLIHGIAQAAPIEFEGWGDTEIIQAMAQFSHECGAGTEMTENINYTAERAVEVWPTRFSSAADCYAKVGSFPGDPDFHGKLIDSVYGTRMGNRPGTHDGRTYIGRGLPQTTGREGYTRLQQTSGLPVLTNPDLLNSPVDALRLGVQDFINCGCLPFAKKDNTVEVTKHLNGGTVGLAEREQWLAKWKAAMVKQGPAPTLTAPPVAKPAIAKKTAAGTAVIATSGAVATQFSHPAIIILIIALGVGIAVALHFFWKKDGG